MKKIFSKIKICSILFLFSLGACMSSQGSKTDEVIEKEKFEPSAYERAKTYADKNPITLLGKDSKDKKFRNMKVVCIDTDIKNTYTEVIIIFFIFFYLFLEI